MSAGTAARSKSTPRRTLAPGKADKLVGFRPYAPKLSRHDAQTEVAGQMPCDLGRRVKTAATIPPVLGNRNDAGLSGQR